MFSNPRKHIPDLLELPDIGSLFHKFQETYQKTAEMSTEEYINTGDETVKEANQKYENEKTSLLMVNF